MFHIREFTFLKLMRILFCSRSRFCISGI